MDNLFLDIETIPSQEEWVYDHIWETTKPPATIKKPESIEAWYKDSLEHAISDKLEKCSFDGAMSHIVAISYAFNDGKIVSKYIEGEVSKEKEMLYNFMEYANTLMMGTTFIGHNISQFDLRMIRQRCLVLGVPLSRIIPWDAKPWDKNPFDTMMQWDGKNFISQDKLAKAFGIECESDMGGSQVYQYWKDGRYQEISEYCAGDVATVRKIYNHMKGI